LGEGNGGDEGARVLAADQCDVGLDIVVLFVEEASEPERAEDVAEPVGEPVGAGNEGEADISARHRIGTAPISIVIVLRPFPDG